MDALYTFFIGSKSEEKLVEMSCNKEMIKMIEVLNKLQDKLVSLGVTDLVKELPQIAVVGAQSAGKSSVLESFVGRDFLPRGGDIVTRRPLILQLKQNSENSETFAKFNHSPKIFTDFEEIRREIEDETDRTVPNSGISPDPISLMITSPDVLDLNLIDLPGMTKVPVGDQPEDIEIIVKNLIKGFISNENCLILAVTPANQDLANSDAIKLSREVDPNGNRTIGVLTKLDLMDKGTNARNILMDQHMIRLKRGFIGVKCRSPQDIKNNKKLSAAMAEEKAFFAEHSAYRDIGHRLGIETLQRYLQNELAEHLYKELPTLREKFTENLNNLNERIEKISIDKIKEMNSNELISKTVKTFSQNFCNEIGTGEDVPIDRKNCGTLINVEMNVIYAEALEAIVHDQKRIKREIGLAIMNIFGTQLELFVPNKAFKIVVRNQLEMMRKPSLKCVDNVYKQLESIVKSCSKDIEMFPILVDLYIKTTLEYLRECQRKCKEMVEHKLDTEKTYLSATHINLVKSIRLENEKKSVPLTQTVVNGGPNTDTQWQEAMPILQPSGYITVNEIQIENLGNLYNGIYYFTIENRQLYWFTNEVQNARRGTIGLRRMKQYICGEKTLRLTKKDFRMELEFESKAQMKEWVSAIIENSYQDNDTELPSKKEEEDEFDPLMDKYPISIDSQVEDVKRRVLDYIKIMEQTLEDTLPKLCQKELIDATEQFVGETLRNLIQNKGFTIYELVDRDPNKEERKSLLKRKSLFEEALKAMEDAMKSTSSNA